MRTSIGRVAVLFILSVTAGAGPLSAGAAEGEPARLTLVERKPDPHGSPRPARDARDVPLRTSVYFELGTVSDAKKKAKANTEDDQVLPESVAIRLQAEGGEPVEVLRTGRRFAEGGSGRFQPKRDFQGKQSLAVYVEPGAPLEPATRYSVHVSARSRAGAELSGTAGTWSFTTEAAPGVRSLTFPLDLGAEPVHWRGAFFSGPCNVIFCTDEAAFGPTNALMAEARKTHPRAWSYQRDFWMTGTEFRKPSSFLAQKLPNIVRERETRRIVAMEPGAAGVSLRVEDVFGHEQYGVPAGRPLSEDYHAGDEVLIADGVHDARAKVIAADDEARTVLVGQFPTPAGGWKIAYDGPLPEREDPDAPGLFPSGGCYLRKFNPHGTACYYWGRLDKEWDLVHRRLGRRLLPNFADAPGDLAIDGRSWTTVKDYAQWHEVARAIAGHIIDRYGEDSLDFTWSIFNEPDLGGLFWRTSWDELQRYYDYTTDAILRAFEDRGYDSNEVFIGGLELGGIFGTHLKLTEFLAHCSPRATAKGALPLNAAVADPRLDGRRSRRVETLCRAHEGKGSPCDFVSIHSYNSSALMAAKLIRAKEMALEIDPEYYRTLWVNSHEACPDWMPPPDEAAADSYLGNGFFPSWCADVVNRQLRQAARDPRFAFGETIMTVWPPTQNFSGMNAFTRVLHCDDDGDGRGDRTVTVPMPIFHALGMLSDLGDRYWVLPERQVGGHTIGGFASRDGRGNVRALLFTHHGEDTQSRSDAEFDVTLDLDLAAPGRDGPARLREYRFDRDHNSYFRLGRALRDRPDPESRSKADPARLETAIRALAGDDPEARREAIRTLEALGPGARSALLPLMALVEKTEDESVRKAAQAAIARVFAPRAYSRAEVEQVRALSECRPTGTSTLPRGREADGHLRIKARVAGNGLNFLVIEPVDDPKTR